MLKLDDGTRLSEKSVILQYLSGLRPGVGLMPPPGSLEHYRVLEWLSFIGSEVHEQFSPLFTPGTGPDWREACVAKLRQRLSWKDLQLGQAVRLVGAGMTIADIYLFAIVNWVRWVPEVDLASWPSLHTWYDRISARSEVATAMQRDGIN